MEPNLNSAKNLLVGIATDDQFALHLTSLGHFESPDRVKKVTDALKLHGLLTDQSKIAPRESTKAELNLAHTFQYIDLVEEESRSCPFNQTRLLSTGDVEISKDSYFVATLAVGAVLEAVDAIFKKRFKAVFCPIRPPGHHATSNQGMGFCLFNNVAIGAKYALTNYPIKRVLIVDWDVHHGNGTQEIVGNDPRIFYFSTHLLGLYPKTGSKNEIGCGNIENHPIGLNTPSEHLIKIFQRNFTESMNKFKPELVFISAGFDAHKRDPLGGKMGLTDEDFGNLTSIVKVIAEKYAEGRVVSVLEGGYNLECLAKCCVSHVKALYK